MAREQLAARGRIDGRPMVTLADGNQAGTGDLVRARLNTKIDAGGQTLANRDMIRITGWRGAGGGLTAVAERRLQDGGWSAPFTVPASYLAENAELGYAGNVFTAQGRTVDAGYGLVNEAMTRDLAYVMATRGRERNVLFVPTGPPDPSVPSRAERDRADGGPPGGRRRAPRAGRHRRGAEGLRAAARTGTLPAGGTVGSGDGRRPGQGRHRSAPRWSRCKAAQDYATNIGHLITITEAFWWQDVVPQIDEQIRERLTPGEYDRYLKDPERPALLQLVREHEIGGRPVGRVARHDHRPVHAGARAASPRCSTAAWKKPNPPPGARRRPSLSACRAGPRRRSREAYQAADATQAEIGRQLAAQARGMGRCGPGAMPPAEPGPLRDDWERRAGLVGAYREAAGITNPEQAIGPVPSGKGILREMFDASIRALELPDDQALLQAPWAAGSSRPPLLQRERAVAVAPPEVSAQLASVERQRDVAVSQAETAAEAADDHLAGSAGALVKIHDGQLASLRVADAAHREWAEAHAPLEAQAQAAERELRERGLAERIPAPPGADHWPMTDAEFDVYLSELVTAAEAPEATAEAETEAAPQARRARGAGAYRAMPAAEFDQYLDRLVAEAEGREWVPPSRRRKPEAEPEPQPGPLSEAEFREQLGRIVAESEGRQFVPAPTPPEPEPQPEPLSEAEFWEQLDRIVAESEGREYAPPEPGPEPEPQPEPLPEPEFRAKLDQIVRDSQREPGAGGGGCPA